MMTKNNTDWINHLDGQPRRDARDCVLGLEALVGRQNAEIGRLISAWKSQAAEIESLKAQLRRGVPDEAINPAVPDIASYRKVPEDGKWYRVWTLSQVVKWDAERWEWILKSGLSDEDRHSFADVCDGWLPEEDAVTDQGGEEESDGP